MDTISENARPTDEELKSNISFNKQNEKSLIVASIILLIIILISAISYYFLKKSPSIVSTTTLLPTMTKTTQPTQEPVTNIVEISLVKSLTTEFRNNLQQRNVNNLISLFTPAKSKEDIDAYNNLMGIEPQIDTPRLFNNVSSNFIVSRWEIAKDSTTNQESITVQGDKYIVITTETRKYWCNAGACAGTYSFENISFYVLEIVKVDNEWLVDKYYPQPASPSKTGTKYEALGF